MVKVLYDHQAFSLQEYGGVSRYHAELLKNPESRLSLLFSNNKYLEERKDIVKVIPHIDFKEKGRLIELINRPYSTYQIKSSKFDIFHPTYYYPYFLKHLNNKPFVITIHDMTHELFGGSKKIIEYKKLLVEKAEKVIAVSDSTKKDILRLYDISEEKVEVIYHGTFLKQNPIKINLNLPSRFILYVGGRAGYKNFNFFLKAAKPVLLDSDVFLVCAGGGSFSSKEKKLFNELGLSGKVLYFSVDDDVLQSLYSKALLFVYPSKYEGFGLPIIEAFSCGCPVVVSDIEVFREVAGDAAIYFNPDDESDMLSAVQTCICDKSLKIRLVSKGNIKADLYSWNLTLEKTIALYQKVC